MGVDRVLLVSPSAGLGGAERVLLDLLNATVPRREVLLLEHGPLEAELCRLGASYEVLPLPVELAAAGESAGTSAIARALVAGISRLPRYVRNLGAALARSSPNVIHSNGMKAHLLVAAAAPTAPLVWHLHDFVGDRRVTRHLLTLTSRAATRAIANSHAVAHDARRALRGVPIDVVWNAVDLARFAPRTSESSARGAAAVRVGLVATYARWKGHDVFLRATKRALERLEPGAAQFFVVGGPIYQTGGSQWSEAELRAIAEVERLGDAVTFIPFQRDPVAVLQSLDVVVHASTRREPFGRVIIEGMASGAAVIATRGGGVDEIIRPELDGVLVPPSDVDALAHAMVRLVADAQLRMSLAAEGRRRAERFGLAPFDAGVVECWTRAAQASRSTRRAWEYRSSSMAPRAEPSTFEFDTWFPGGPSESSFIIDRPGRSRESAGS